MNTSYNLILDDLSEGQSLGTEPPAQDVRDLNTRLGIVAYKEKKIGSENVIVGHAGFGLQGQVEKLKKGQFYS